MAYRIAVTLGMILLGGLCGWRSARLALVTTPLGLTQDDAEYHFRKWQGRTDGELDRAELDLTLTLNPRHAEAWIARGLREETEGGRPKAETTLLHAAEIDRTYLPRWTLANFYLRQGDVADFWLWARRAAEMAYDPGALFQLCWRASGDAREILERAIPAEPWIRRAYLDFLVRTKRLEASWPLVEEIGRTADLSDKARLLEYCDAEITLRRRAKPALDAWNALSARRIIPYGALDPAAGVSLSNGGFTAQPLMQGFDWRAPRVEGASLSFDTATHEMALSLEGRQPEFCDFVEQYAPVISGASYRFHYRYRTRDLSAETGLAFILMEARTGEEFAAGAIPASPGDGGGGTIAFSTPPGCELVRILLRYRRPGGSVRAEGGAVFTRLALELAQAPGASIFRSSGKWDRRAD